MSSVVWHKASVHWVDASVGLCPLFRSEHPHWFVPALGQSLLLSAVFLERVPRDDGVALAKVLASLWHETSVAGHVVLLGVVVRHVEGGDRVLFGVAGKVRLGFGCHCLQGGGVLSQSVFQSGRRVALELGQCAHLLKLVVVFVLVELKRQDGVVTRLSVAAAKVVQLLRNVTCSV